MGDKEHIWRFRKGEMDGRERKDDKTAKGFSWIMGVYEELKINSQI